MAGKARGMAPLIIVGIVVFYVSVNDAISLVLEARCGRVFERVNHLREEFSRMYAGYKNKMKIVFLGASR